MINRIVAILFMASVAVVSFQPSKAEAQHYNGGNNYANCAGKGGNC
jgi:hypothetical protein